MVLTEFEFENLLSTATKEEFKVPDELNKKLKKRIKNKYRFNRMRKAIPASFAACLLVGVVLISAMNNDKKSFDAPKYDNSANNGIVISSEKHKSRNVEQTVVSEKAGEEAQVASTVNEKNIETKNDTAIVTDEAPVVITDVVAQPVEEFAEEVQTADVTEETIQPMSRMGGGGGVAAPMLLCDYLDGDEEARLLVSERIKEKISDNSDGIEYFEDFSSVSGNERYYLTEENELVVIFDAGVIAKEENGEIYFNVGKIK